MATEVTMTMWPNKLVATQTNPRGQSMGSVPCPHRNRRGVAVACRGGMGLCVSSAKDKTGYLDPDDHPALYARWPKEDKQEIERLASSFKVLDKDGSGRLIWTSDGRTG